MNRTSSKVGGGTEFPCPLLIESRHAALPAWRCVHQPKAPPASWSQVCITQAQLIKSHSWTQSLVPVLPVEVGDGAEGSNPLLTWEVFLVLTSTLNTSRGPGLSHLISINSSMVEKVSLWVTKDTPIAQEIPKVLGTPGQELGTKTRYIFCYTTLPAHESGSWCQLLAGQVEAVILSTCLWPFPVS